jgi:hypothetical protein
VDFVRRVLAEWPLLRTRLVRTRLGLWLLLLTGALLWLERHAPAPDPLGTALAAGALGAVLAVAYLAGSGTDRMALVLVLGHPTTPRAVAVGRWLAATGGAALVVLACAVHSAWATGAVAASLGAALAGLMAAAAIAACTLALVWTGGNTLAGVCFLYLVLLGSVPPEALIGDARPGAVRLVVATLLELAPGQWRYRGLAVGDVGAALHAMAWVCIGLLIAEWRAARLGRRAG